MLHSQLLHEQNIHSHTHTHTKIHTHTQHTHTHTPAYPAHASVAAAHSPCPRLLASAEKSPNVSGRIRLLYKFTIVRTFESVRFLEEEEELTRKVLEACQGAYRYKQVPQQARMNLLHTGKLCYFTCKDTRSLTVSTCSCSKCTLSYSEFTLW